jgi:hypothetical protein
MRTRLPDDAQIFDWATDEVLLSGHPWGLARWLGSIWPFFLALGFWAAVSVRAAVYPPPQMTPAQTALLIVGLLALVLALFGFVLVQAGWRLLHRTRAIYLFPDGFVYRTTAGEWGGARWDQVREVWRAETMYHGVVTRSYVRLVLDDDTVLLLDRALAGYPALAGEVETRAARGMLPRLIARYEAGKRLRFGPFEMDRDGVRWGPREGQEAAWSQVKGFQLLNGALLVHGPPLNIWLGRGVELRKVPNQAALFALLDLPGWEKLKKELPPA